MEKKVEGLRPRLYRCLKVAINDEKLECQVGHIVLELAEVMKNPDYHSPILDAWCDYFLKQNESPVTGTHKLHLSCPRCGNTGWIRKDDAWECSACGELSYTEDMCSKAEEV